MRSYDFILRPTACTITCLILSGLSGCGGPSAPSHVFFGAYFPSWLLFAVLWVLLAVAVRLLMVLTGSGTSWPWPLALCLASGFLLALASWFLIAGALP
ncbi:hypothetical protein [Ottowia thiooxydans]|uniref:hypothetical protein n=1 Tax=Ottowia thiooxydans TaxID=219182 RepID=UPI00042139DA|nr:hypothetical protein [Ottowia thiooxydans]